MNYINEDTQEILADIFENIERPDKIRISLEKDARTMTVVYEHLDCEWFKELSMVHN